MASQINPSNIDATFPIAGQDNDTQGFRTNYINIKNNFATAAREISALQDTQTATQYTNANVAAFLPTYTGNISAGNLTVSSITYTNQEVVTSTEVVTGNITAAQITLTGALQFANLTTSQISLITPSRGMTVYNYNTGNIQVYNGTKWANVTLS